MKQFLLGLILVFSFISMVNVASAQFNYIGGGIILATGGEYESDGFQYYNKSLALNLRLNYNVNKKIELLTSFNLFVPNKEEFAIGGNSKTNLMSLNLDGHYILNPKSRKSYRVYALAGIHLSRWNIENTMISTHSAFKDKNVKESRFVFGANLGVGMNVRINNRLLFYAETKYLVSEMGQLMFNPGLMYEF
ncbi:MAG: outer membrane beta-barrel protein [Bacteroidales bacterium]|nr:outer membrane beta-barrel protein [Bacteroidales bacterium]